MEISLPAAVRNLPGHRARLEAASRAVATRSDVVAMLIGGSLASDEADVYPDLDIQLIVRDEDLNRMTGELRAIADESGPVVAAFTAEHVGLPHMLIVLYEDLIHADFEPVALSKVGERNAGLATHVFWEREGVVSASLPAKHADEVAADLAWIEARIWTWSWYVQTKVLRGELYEALDGINYIRNRVLFRVLALRRGERPASARRAEQRTGEWGQRFAATVPQLDRASVMNALHASLTLYMQLADPLLDRHDVARADRARATVLPTLEAGLAWQSPS